MDPDATAAAGSAGAGLEEEEPAGTGGIVAWTAEPVTDAQIESTAPPDSSSTDGGAAVGATAAAEAVQERQPVDHLAEQEQELLRRKVRVSFFVCVLLGA